MRDDDDYQDMPEPSSKRKKFQTSRNIKATEDNPSTRPIRSLNTLRYFPQTPRAVHKTSRDPFDATVLTKRSIAKHIDDIETVPAEMLEIDPPTEAEKRFVQGLVDGLSLAGAYMVAYPDMARDKEYAELVSLAQVVFARASVARLVADRKQEFFVGADERLRIRKLIVRQLEILACDENISASQRINALDKLAKQYHVKAYDQPDTLDDDGDLASTEIIDKIRLTLERSRKGKIRHD